MLGVAGSRGAPRCLVRNLSGVQSDEAAISIQNACAKLYPRF